MTPLEADAGEDEGEIARMPSHVPGLDAVLCGGFLQGGLYMVQGPPGAGKTVLASQILYGRAAAGACALFITVLGENHGRMLAHLRPMRFFDPSAIPDRVAYVSAYQALEDEGPKGLLTLLRREVLAHKATLLVLDGLSAIEAKVEAGFEMKRFTHELQTLASVADCTMFLLTTSDAASAPERTMVDGLVELRQHPHGARNERRIVVHKLRGSASLEGEHAFRITREGVAVFPRIEALLARPSRGDPPPRARVSSGIASLDVMLGGGIPGATMTALAGPSGAGKTTLALQFLSRCSVDEPGLLLGFYEPPERLRLKAATMGFDLAAAEQQGIVELLWFPIGEHILDELAHRLLDAVQRRGVRRLVIDGVSGFQQAALEPERIVRFWSALSNELRALGVTTVHTLEMPDPVGTDSRVPANEISALAEVIVLMRHVELRSRLHRLMSLFKVREGAFDPRVRTFAIGDAGITVGEPFTGVEAVPDTMAREAAAGASEASPEGNDQGPSGDGTGRPG